MAQQRLILNKYLPIKEIGTGGFGTVFVAKDMLVQRLVAIKRIELTELDALRAEWVREDMAREAQIDAINAFETGKTTISLITPGEEDDLASSLEQRYLADIPGLDEARTASALSDPTIVSIYDCQIAGNVVYLIMEYVEGLTLAQLLDQHGDEITLDVVSAVAESVSRALRVAHEHGVLHFDIKPDNVLIDAEGNVKVTDFGLATLSDAQGQGTAAAGTIGYMPLEQMRREPLSARTDEWALASIVYEMLVGQNPFMADTLEEAETLIDGAELTLPSRCWDDVPEEVDDVIFRALDPDVEDRYETVADFAADLLPCLGNPRRGHQDLAALVKGEEIEDDPEGDELAPLEFLEDAGEAVRVKLHERFSDFQKSLGMRLFAALSSGLLGALGTWNIEQLSGLTNPLFWAFVAGCAALGAIKSHVGALAALVVLSAALLANHAYVVGVLLLVASCLWWWFVARVTNAVANALLSFAPFSAIGIAPVGVCLVGYCSTVPRALASSAFGAFLCLILASFGSLSITGWFAWANWNFAAVDVQANMLVLLGNLGTWAIIISWVLTALLLSLCGKPRRRFVAIIGVVGAFFLLMVGIWCAAQFDADASMLPTASALVCVCASAAVALFAFASFPAPERSAKEPFDYENSANSMN